MTQLRIALLLVGMLAAGSIGAFGASCTAHLYNDHLLVDAVRENSLRQQIQQQSAPKPPQ